MLLNSFTAVQVSEWLYFGLSITCILICVILSLILQLSKSVWSSYPLNYCLVAIMAILSTVAAALAYPTSSIYCKLVAAGLTILISLGIIPIGLYMRLINTMGLIVFVSLESVLILSGCIMYYFGNYFRYVAEVCWIFSISIIIFMIANQLKLTSRTVFPSFA
ncbi:unnamed protein product [Heterobilharzia americana]|nr:unnamed protein product [Heterobilharzia americana]